MPQKVRIALDAMGGDVGASVVIPGAAAALIRHPDSEFLLYGDSALIEAQLAKYPALKKVSQVVHTDVTVSMHDKPSQALRRGRKNSSMWLAIDAVKKGDAHVAVSAGNTGALMAMARFHLHTMPGIDRPAIAGVWPTMRGDSVVLDLGASIGGDHHHLVALAVMGGAMASVLFGDRVLIDAQLARHPAMKAVSRVIHTDVAVSMHDKPSQALRRGRKNSSMWLAIDAVKKGEAHVAVSAGNTGALMAMARFHLHTMPGIDRPAIAGVWPTARGDSVVLDLGASIGGDAHHLVSLAVMGGAMASVLLDRKSTRLNSSHPRLSRMPSSA